ncbi:MAG: DUF805 domain-containing protein [Pseudomonadota bacterium]
MAQGARAPTIPWALFGFDGRISREIFWLSFLLVNFAGAFLTPRLPAEIVDAGPTPEIIAQWIASQPLAIAVLFVELFALVAIFTKRLHDRGLTGWLTLVLFVPFVNIVAFLFIAFAPGNKGANGYAAGPNMRGPT